MTTYEIHMPATPGAAPSAGARWDRRARADARRGQEIR